MRNIAQEPEKYFMAIESNAPYLHSKLEEMRQALRFMPDELKSDFPKPLWDLSLDPDNYLPLLIIEVLRKMTWRFYVSDNPAFFTSDNPAFLDNIAPPYGFVRFPMSSHIALEANWQVGPDLERFQATESKIMEIDSWVIGGATRNIYHSGNVDWVLQRFDI